MKMRFIVLALLLCGCKLSCFAPRADLIDAPVAETLQSADADGATFDHSVYDALLAAHVRRDDGRVDYAALKADEHKLDAYLERLAAADLESLSRSAQQALLFNAYNAFTLKLILEHYPGIDSIKDLRSPWKTERWNVGGSTLSLDEIEHGLLRPVYQDPRVHFGVNCASIGCPPLADFAFTGARLDAQLEDVTRSTLNNPRYARVEGSTLHLTQILNWYGDDFVAEGWSPRADTLAGFVSRYRDDVPADPTVKFIDYDWQLNDTR